MGRGQPLRRVHGGDERDARQEEDARGRRVEDGERREPRGCRGVDDDRRQAPGAGTRARCLRLEDVNDLPEGGRGASGLCCPCCPCSSQDGERAQLASSESGRLHRSFTDAAETMGEPDEPEGVVGVGVWVWESRSVWRESTLSLEPQPHPDARLKLRA